MSLPLDKAAATVAVTVVGWLGRHVDEARSEWMRAFAAELDDIEGGWEKLRWALGGVTLLWSFRRQRRRSRSWLLAGDPRALARVLSEHRREALAFFSTASLLLLALFVIFALLPVFQQAAARAGLALPLPYRMAIVVLSLLKSPVVLGAGLLLGLVMLRRSRMRPGRSGWLMRAFPVMNFATFVLLVALGTGFIEITWSIRAERRARERRLMLVEAFEDGLLRGLIPMHNRRKPPKD